MKRFILAAIAIAILALCGCNRPGKELMGKWANTAMQETVEFKADNSGVFQVQGMPSLPFSWKMLDKERIVLDVPFQGKSKTLYGRLTGDSFMLEGEGGQQAVYRRSSDK